MERHRMELIEVRQLDQVRLLSEQQHEQEATEQRRQLQTRLELASFQEWKEIFFPFSWILAHEECVHCLEPFLAIHHNNNDQKNENVLVDVGGKQTRNQTNAKNNQKTFRLEFLRLLLLEDKARQWYSSVSRAYFRQTVCPAIASHDDDDHHHRRQKKKNDDHHKDTTLPAAVNKERLKTVVQQEVKRLEQTMFCLSGK